MKNYKLIDPARLPHTSLTLRRFSMCIVIAFSFNIIATVANTSRMVNTSEVRTLVLDKQLSREKATAVKLKGIYEKGKRDKLDEVRKVLIKQQVGKWTVDRLGKPTFYVLTAKACAIEYLKAPNIKSHIANQFAKDADKNYPARFAKDLKLLAREGYITINKRK